MLKSQPFQLLEMLNAKNDLNARMMQKKVKTPINFVCSKLNNLTLRGLVTRKRDVATGHFVYRISKEGRDTFKMGEKQISSFSKSRRQ